MDKRRAVDVLGSARDAVDFRGIFEDLLDIEEMAREHTRVVSAAFAGGKALPEERRNAIMQHAQVAQALYSASAALRALTDSELQFFNGVDSEGTRFIEVAGNRLSETHAAVTGFAAQMSSSRFAEDTLNAAAQVNPGLVGRLTVVGESLVRGLAIRLAEFVGRLKTAASLIKLLPARVMERVAPAAAGKGLLGSRVQSALRDQMEREPAPARQKAPATTMEP